MRETRFIEQMKEKWSAFERQLSQPQQTPEKLYQVFINVMNDLSFARTFYKNRSVRVYLNGLAQQIFANVYKNRTAQKGRLLAFWTDELPQAIYDARRTFLITTLLFFAAFAIGALSCAMDDGFAEVILGEAYVEMTKTNIENGDPMAVYKDSDRLGMSLGIAGNNVFVALLTFVLGLTFTIGTIGVLVSNGIMVGAFQYFFIKEGLFWDSFLTIWMHGTLEISAIIIAATAGIEMGKGLVFPGTYSRLKAFQQTARRGLKIFIGIVPILLLAAFIEGFVTRNTDTAYWIRGLFILICLAFVLGYFVWYPNLKSRVGFQVPNKTDRILPDEVFQMNWYAVKPVSTLFSNGLALFRKHFGQTILVAFICALLYAMGAYLLAPNFVDTYFFPDDFFGMFEGLDHCLYNDLAWLPTLVILPSTFLVFWSLQKVSPSVSPSFGGFLKLLFGVGICYMLAYLTEQFAVLLILVVHPFLVLWVVALYQSEGSLIHNTSHTFALVKSSFGQLFGLLFMFLLLSLAVFLFFDTTAFLLLFNFLSWILPYDQATTDIVSTFILIVLAMTVFYSLLALILYGFTALYFSLRESQEAIELKQQIQNLGIGRRIRGLERE